VNVRRSLLCVFGLLAACASTPGGSTRAERGLVGARLPLIDAPARRLEVAGAVGSNPARVLLDVTRPLTLVAEGCLSGVAVAMSGEHIKVPSAAGDAEVYPALSLRELRVGGAALGAIKVGLVEGEASCRVWVGLDLLGDLALEIDPLRREVLMSASRPAEAYPLMEAAQDEAVGLVALSREPTTDVPLLPARLTLDTVGFAGTFVLATAEESSTLWLPPGAVEVTAELGEEAMIAPSEIELVAGLPLKHAPLSVGAGSGSAVLGGLGADTWGRFHAIIDVKARALRLSRPKSAAAACEDARCVRSAVLKREAGPEGSVIVWGELARGGVATLQAVGPDGAPLCELAVAFPPSGAGEGMAFPLSGADSPGAGCAAAASRLEVVNLALGNPASAEGVCVAGALGGERRCRAGSARGREVAGSEVVESPEEEEELTEPEDPPPPPRRTRPQVR